MNKKNSTKAFMELCLVHITQVNNLDDLIYYDGIMYGMLFVAEGINILNKNEIFHYEEARKDAYKFAFNKFKL